MKVQAAPPEHYGWLAARTGCTPTAGFRAIEAVDDSGRIRGAVGFDGWTDNSAQVHVAVGTPIVCRALWGPAFEYPFLQAGRGLLIGVIPANNKRSVRLAQHLGFREAHRIREGWARGVDLVVFEMRKEECRWIRQTERKAA